MTGMEEDGAAEEGREGTRPRVSRERWEVTTYEFEPLPKGTVLTLPADVRTAMAARAAKIDATTRKEVSP